MALDAPVHTDEANLTRVLGVGLPVLLVFWRNGCAPCEQYAPTLEHLARKWAGQALVVKVDANSEPGLISKYAVRYLPSTVFVKSGNPIASAVGALAEPSVEAWVSYLVRGGTQPEVPTGPNLPLAGAPRSTPRYSGAAGKETRHGEHSVTGVPIVLTDETWDATLRSTRLPILVDFWAAWCAPCKTIAPAVAEIARDYAGRVLVAKLDVDNNPRVAALYSVMSLPTLLIFRDGQVIDQLIGAHPARVIRDHLARAMAK